ncbi:transposase [Anaerolactibacter massiliensis]|uniref:transposase n=1 Tax=Anaerolactibacter massiliensis TaxID=2044573 RepID=UPI000CF95687|nr:transposase [Anaerolactibacter massiliensis]
MELTDLLNDLETCGSRVDRIMEEVTDLLWQIPNTRELFRISGVGPISVLTFVAEVGDISRIKDAKALQKLAGLAIAADSSDKHNGESGISYRGRKRLRWCVYQLAISLISRNRDSAAIHAYYTTRKENPLKKMQSLIAVGCKALKVFYKILTTGIPYDGQKMTADIIRPSAA